MKHAHRLGILLLLTLPALPALLVLTACDNPAEGISAAEVSEPAEGNSAQGAANEENSAEGNSAGAATLTIDRARSSVGFIGAKVTDSHEGSFSDFSGTVRLPGDSVEQAQVSITIQMASVRIEPPRLLTHIQSPDLFDVQQYPTATFVSSAITAGAEGEATHTVRGRLTLHGQTREIAFPATLELSAQELHASARFSINRQQFGIVYPGQPDNLIRDEVVIHFDVHAPRAAQ